MLENLVSPSAATILSAAITGAVLVAIAIGTRRYHRTIAADAAVQQRKRATWEFIQRSELNNPEWPRLRQHFAEACEKDGGLAALAQPSSEQVPDSIQVAAFLNHFELVAISIKNQAFDEKVYAEWFQGSYVKAWEESQAFVVAMRKRRGNKRIFIEFQQLAEKWAKEIKARSNP